MIHPQRALALLLFAFCTPPLPAAPPRTPAPARFMATPDIHQDQIVFACDGDLWLVSAQGGTATHLTSVPGDEQWPRFSPDGRWVAFTAAYDGVQAVYRIATRGGDPQRLTWTPGTVQTVGWTPDGKDVVFTSSMLQVVERDPALFRVGLHGTAPERLPVDHGSFCCFSPDGRQLIYNRHGYLPPSWKRYKGGMHPDLWHYDFTTRKYERLVNDDGKCAFPMWIGNRVWFLSDHFGGICNLVSTDFETRAIVPATRYQDSDVATPATDGRRIVYTRDGWLHVFDPASGQDRRLTVTLSGDRWRARNRTINPRDYIHGMDLSADGRTALLEARGDLFTLPTGKHGQTRNLSRNSGSREMLPSLSPDGRKIAFFSDRSGEYELYTQPLKGGAWTTLTTTLKAPPTRPVWSPDGKKILFGTREYAWYVLELDGKRLTRIEDSGQLKNDTFDSMADGYGWSPDSRWVCYTVVAPNQNRQVVLYSLDQHKRFVITDDFFNTMNPCFDLNGDYLYYLSSRNFEARLDVYDDNHMMANPFKVVAVQLRAGLKPPFADDEDTTGTDGATEKKDDQPTTKTTTAAPMRIDIAGLDQRTFPLPVPAGAYDNLRAGRGTVLWCAVSDFDIGGDPNKPQWTLHIFDMKERKDTALEEKISDYELAAGGEQILVKIDREYAAQPLARLREAKKTGDRLRLDGMVYRINTFREWAQIFNDVWRWYRDLFYDAAMHGHDWQAIGKRYRARVAQLDSRASLNQLMAEMVGELCVSHAYIRNGDLSMAQTLGTPLHTGCLGADLAWDAAAGCYRFARIYGPTRYEPDLTAPLVRPDIRLREGDCLLAIDGRPLRNRADYFRRLQVTDGQQVSLTVNDTPTTAGARTYEVEPLKSDHDLRYQRWLADNIDKVDKASGGRLGYMHIRSMAPRDVADFDKFWRAFHTRDGIIIDVRGNGGGWTEYFLIDKLERRQVGMSIVRGKLPYRYPGMAAPRRFVALTNEYNASDGELFIQHFKERGLGKVVGTHSWGGLVGIAYVELTVDNGNITLPSASFYGPGGNFWVENRGADPDIELDNDPAAVAAGRDPQLEKGIEILMKEIDQDHKDHAQEFSLHPKYPKR